MDHIIIVGDDNNCYMKSDRWQEIINYQEWRDTEAIPILKEQYKLFVQHCLENTELLTIISFDDWTIRYF